MKQPPKSLPSILVPGENNVPPGARGHGMLDKPTRDIRIAGQGLVVTTLAAVGHRHHIANAVVQSDRVARVVEPKASCRRTCTIMLPKLPVGEPPPKTTMPH